MKRLLLCLALVAPLGVQAEEKDTCTLYGTLAESIMKGHQSGVPLSKALAVSETITPEIKAIGGEL